ncbi:MAG: TusE/DsrC/DsvC family sulfur relay protein [Gammaproteobacteria bacterium]|jgi:tRNA 2-thiouridine synthesizing protein E
MLNKTKLQRDFEGYMLDPEDWNRDLARALAAEEHLELTGDYWQILDFMREYWFEHRVAPDVRHVVEFLMNEHGYDKKQAKGQLFDLFPYGYVKQACKIAGMQHPRAWSTG